MVGANPRLIIARLSDADKVATLSKWDRAISRQASRLYALSGKILGQDALAVIDPGLKERLEEVVGSKLDRVTMLEKIGAELVMYSFCAGGL
jgi:translation initiation factor 6 (eIF-6)